MINFKQYAVNEMSIAVKKAALNKNEGMFKQALLSDFYKAQGQIMSGKVEGAKDVEIHQADDTHMWPYMTMKVDTEDGTKNIEIRVANKEPEELDEITDYEIYVDGKRFIFDTTTDQEAKRTGSVEAGVSYLIYGIKRAAHDKTQKSRENRKQNLLQSFSLEELEQEIARRKMEQ